MTRPAPPAPHNPTIDRHAAAPARTHRLHGAATVVAWVVYAWLWLPLITVVAWLLGVRTSYIELYMRDHRFEPTLVVTLPLLALACALLLIGWAEWNRWRFGDRERRGAHEDVAPADVARALHAPEHVATRLSDAKLAVLTMDAEGRPQAVNVSRAVSAAAR